VEQGPPSTAYSTPFANQTSAHTGSNSQPQRPPSNPTVVPVGSPRVWRKETWPFVLNGNNSFKVLYAFYYYIMCVLVGWWVGWLVGWLVKHRARCAWVARYGHNVSQNHELTWVAQNIAATGSSIAAAVPNWSCR
jgi:hypothetical protein